MEKGKQPSTLPKGEGCVVSGEGLGDFSLLPYRRKAGSAITTLMQKLSLLQAFSTDGLYENIAF